MFGADGAAHARVRRIVGRLFAAPRLVELEGHLRALVQPLVANMVARGGGELVMELAQPIPLRLMTDLLDVPSELRDACWHWSDAFTDAGQPFLTDSERSAITLRIAECRGFMAKHVCRALAGELRGAFPDLIAPTEDGDRLTAAELLDICMLLIVAGYETTSNLIGNAAHVLLCHPELMRRVRRHKPLLLSFLEEVLRFESPVQRTTRVTRLPVELAGCQIPQGAQIIVLLGSANRDEEKFPRADEFTKPHPQPSHCFRSWSTLLSRRAIGTNRSSHCPRVLAAIYRIGVVSTRRTDCVPHVIQSTWATTA